MSEVTLKEVQTFCIELFKQKAVCDTVEERLDAEKEKMRAIENKIAQAFEASGVEKHNVKGVGTVYRQEYESYKLPATPEEKAKLKEHMGDLWDAMASIHSATLNSWAKAEREKAIEEGNTAFKIPGLEDPIVSYKIKTRKG